MLAEGRSIESIARETGRAASTVAYWVNKHGLMSAHATAPRRAEGSSASNSRRSSRKGSRSAQIANRCGVSATAVRHWLRRTNSRRSGALCARGQRRPRAESSETAGPTAGARSCGSARDGGYRCARCHDGAVHRSRGASREILVAEAGGACVVRVRPLRRRAPVPSPSIPRQRRSRSAVRGSPARCRCPLGGPEVRPAVRELPRDGRGRALNLPASSRQRPGSATAPVGGSSTAEHSALTEGLWVRIPPPELQRKPPQGAAFSVCELDRRSVPPTRPRPRARRGGRSELGARTAGRGKRSTHRQGKRTDLAARGE